jgi:hypothetical protein
VPSWALVINAILSVLKDEKLHALSIGDVHVNNFVNANDVTRLSSTLPGIQYLIDCCSSEAIKWRASINRLFLNTLMINYTYPCSIHHNDSPLLAGRATS